MTSIRLCTVETLNIGNNLVWGIKRKSKIKLENSAGSSNIDQKSLNTDQTLMFLLFWLIHLILRALIIAGTKWNRFSEAQAFLFASCEACINVSSNPNSQKSLYTVDSRYLEVEGTHWNTSRYPYFDISDVPNWGKYQSNYWISQLNM